MFKHLLVLSLLCATLVTQSLQAAPGTPKLSKQLTADKALAEPSAPLFEAPLKDFSDQAYLATVEASLAAWEHQRKQVLTPGAKKAVALKVYTNSGGGLSTPKALTRAVVAALERRGFPRSGIIIYDLTESGLRDAGYLPALSVGGNLFEGIRVVGLREAAYYDSLWFYDSPLPSRTRTRNELDIDIKLDSGIADPEDRKSFIPVPLINQVDYWINLPMVIDEPGLGISGALANATVWNASNTRRFLNSPANAPVAVSEMAAIPELRQPWVFTIMTLERYQFIGGPYFHSLYTGSERRLWLSENPVIMDALMLERMNTQRARCRLPQITPRPLLLDYAQAIGLGAWQQDLVPVIPVVTP